jgi:hypothetical protein
VGYAKSAGMVIVDWFYDKAVRGADVITERSGFVAMLDRIAGNGVRTIIVESPDLSFDSRLFSGGGSIESGRSNGLGMAILDPLLPDRGDRGPPISDKRRMVNGILWVLRTGPSRLRLEESTSFYAAGYSIGARITVVGTTFSSWSSNSRGCRT